MTDTDITNTADTADSAESAALQTLQTLPSVSEAVPNLAAAAATTLTSTPASPLESESESESEPSKILTFRMPLFHPGTKVRLKGQGREEIVSHIMVRKQLLSVHLVGREIAVRPEDLEVKPTVFSTQRRPEPALI